MDFVKYTHIERYGNDEVQGIELGECYVFPKLDGTNGSVWWHDGSLHCGSRNRELSIDNDNQGFMAAMLNDNAIKKAAQLLSGHIIYGEWLCPHSLQTYRDDAWRKFYIFDVYDLSVCRYTKYDWYSEKLSSIDGLNIIPPITKFKNATHDALLEKVKSNTWLIKDGSGCGEGIVIKNYGYLNKYGRMCYAKIVTNEFKEKNLKTFGPNRVEFNLVEHEIVDEFLTKPMAEKVYAKITNEELGWNSRYIPRLLGTVYHDFVTEELWNAVKRHKMPTINFKTLNSLVIIKTKQLLPELF